MSPSPASTTVRSASSRIGCIVSQAGGAIVLLATHDLDLADGLVTSVALIRDGRLAPTSRRPDSAPDIGRLSGCVTTPAEKSCSESRAARWRRTSRSRSEPGDPLTTIFFALACVLIFSFAFVKAEGQPLEDAAAGILWVAIAVCGDAGAGRTFERRRHGNAPGAPARPGSRLAIYVGKLFGSCSCSSSRKPAGSAHRSAVSGGPVHAPTLLIGLLPTGLSVLCRRNPLCSHAGRARTRDVMPRSCCINHRSGNHCWRPRHPRRCYSRRRTRRWR